MSYTYTSSAFSSPSANTTHNIPLLGAGAGTLANRRVIVIINAGASSITNPAGWTYLNISPSAPAVSGYWRDCDGSEGANLTITTGSSVVISAICFGFAAYEVLTSQAVQLGTKASGTSVSPNSPSITPSWGATPDTLYVSIAATGVGVFSTSAYPAGYTAHQRTIAGTATKGMLSLAAKEVKGSPDDAGAFTATSAAWIATPLAIRLKRSIVPRRHTNIQGFGGLTLLSGTTPVSAGSSALPLPLNLSGKRAIVAMHGSSTAPGFPAGWTRFINVTDANSLRFVVGYRDCDGSEGETVTLTTPAGSAYPYSVLVLPAGFFDPTKAPEGATNNPGTPSTTPDPPSLTPSWGSADNFVIAYCARYGGNNVETLSSYPTGYDSFRNHEQLPENFGVVQASALVTGASANPGVFTFSGSNLYISATVAIKVTGAMTATLAEATPPLEPSLHTNTQTFYAHKLATRYALAARHDNAQAFYAPTLKARYQIAARFDNAQTFYDASIISAPPPATLAPPFFTNAQAFYGPTLVRMQRLSPSLHTNTQATYTESVKARYKVSARFDNEQVFYDAAITRLGKIVPPLHTNAQVFYAATILTPRFLTPPLHTNAQTFYAHTLHFGLVTHAPFHTNAQSFYGPKLRLMVKLAALHTNAQAFYAPKLRDGLKPTLHTNAQAFYGVTLKFAPRLYPGFHVNDQTFYGHTIKAPRLFVAPFHVNAHKLDYQHKLLFFTPPKPVEPGDGVSALGPFHYSEGIRDPKPKRKIREPVVWNIKPGSEIVAEPPPWHPVVVTPELARQVMRARMKQDAYLKGLRVTRAKREREIEDTVIKTVIDILKED